jgi:hypothetical protein
MVRKPNNKRKIEMYLQTRITETMILFNVVVSLLLVYEFVLGERVEGAERIAVELHENSIRADELVSFSEQTLLFVDRYSGSIHHSGRRILLFYDVYFLRPHYMVIRIWDEYRALAIDITFFKSSRQSNIGERNSV